MKNDFKCSDISFMHNHTLHDPLHQIYVSYLKQKCRVKKGLRLDKSFKKTFGEKEGNSNKSEFQRILNPNQTGSQE